MTLPIPVRALRARVPASSRPRGRPCRGRSREPRHRVRTMVAGLAMISAHILPLAFGIPVLLRDVVLSGAFLFLARRGFGRPKVRRVGKTATFALLFAMPALVLGHGLRRIGLVVFVIGGVLYYVAGFRYWQDVRAFLAHQRRPFAE